MVCPAGSLESDLLPSDALSSRGAIWRSPGMRPMVALTAAWVTGYASLISAAPLWVTLGGADEVGAGLVNGVMLFVTIVGQLGVPFLLRRFGHSRVLIAGCLALALPSPFYAVSSALEPILVLSAIRGLGLAIVTVTNAAVFAELVPAARRSTAAGIYGLGSTIPTLVFVPLSVVIATHFGF